MTKIFDAKMLSGRIILADFGNTRTKTMVFENGQPSGIMQTLQTNDCMDWIASVGAQLLVCICVSDAILAIKTRLSKLLPTIIIDNNLPLPFENHYLSGATLGIDRIAGIAGCRYLNPDNCPAIVADAGSCLTIDVFDGKAYLGGIISPGLQMRFVAMHEHTARLPLLSSADTSNEPPLLPGRNTRECMIAGATLGMAAEINGLMATMALPYPNARLYICGGDAQTLLPYISLPIVHEPNLLFYGMYALIVNGKS